MLKPKRYYTGAGSRITPMQILQLMTTISSFSSSLGLILRSGGALGADQSFELGASWSTIYLPWKEYNNHYTGKCILSSQAMDIAKEFHPAWNYLPETVKKLHARNVYQILGDYLDDPSMFLCCWTPDGCISHETRTKKSGGTGMAISIADNYNVPIINLYRADHRKYVFDMITEYVT